MGLLDVLQFPDARLRRVSQPIEAVTDEIRKLALGRQEPARRATIAAAT